MKIDGGATIWARQTTESDIFSHKPDKWFKIWFYLVNKANHKDTKQFARGSCFMKYEWIMEKTKATRNEVKHCIGWLKSEDMIATRKSARGFFLEVLNYDKFQNLQSYKSQTKAKQKPIKTESINKNAKNVKDIVELMNQILGTSFKCQTDLTQKLISGRLSEGYSTQDFKRVIEYKKKDWENTEQEKYLRPQTLFRPSNFESYLQQAKKAGEKKKGRIL